MCVEGATDAKAFEVYIEHFLAPTLCEEGQVVVMDNLGAHRPKRMDKGAHRSEGSRACVRAVLFIRT